TIEPGRGHFEVVGVVDDALRIDEVTDLPAQPPAVVDTHAPHLVHEDPEDAATTVAAPLDVDERETVMAHHRRDHVLDACLLLVVLHPRLEPCPRRKARARAP